MWPPRGRLGSSSLHRLQIGDGQAAVADQPACLRRLLAALSPGTGMAFILIQHLTAGGRGDAARAEHIYLIPPGAYLSIQGSALRLSQPRERHGAPPAVRLFPALVGGRARRTRDLRDPLANRRRRQPGLKGSRNRAGSSSRRIPTRPSTSRRAAGHHELVHMELSRTVSPPALSAPHLCG
jgi:hypothetical protein